MSEMTRPVSGPSLREAIVAIDAFYGPIRADEVVPLQYRPPRELTAQEFAALQW